MALYDNPLWILSHIQNSFMVSDDSGNSELVMASDKFDCQLANIARRDAIVPFLELRPTDLEDDFRPKSLEIRIGTNSMGYRPRCNTEIKLERMKKEQRKNPPFVRTVSWKTSPKQLSTQDLAALFPKKGTTSHHQSATESAAHGKNCSSLGSAVQRKSLLSYQLQQTPMLMQNPFADFSRFCGSSEEESRSLNINLALGRDQLVPAPAMSVRVKATAKVHDVIGFICWLYTRENRQPPLKPDVDLYSLYLADDGQVEWDLPTLERHEVIAKYGFRDLFLVQSEQEQKKSFSVTINLPDGTFTVIDVLSKNITVKELMAKVTNKRLKDDFPFQYNIERYDTPDVALDPNMLLSGIDTDHYYIVRANSRRNCDTSASVERAEVDNESMCLMEAASYKEYSDLKLLTKLRSKVNVSCAISDEKLDVIPTQSSSPSSSATLLPVASSSTSAAFWAPKVHSRHLQMHQVVACDLVAPLKPAAPYLISIVYQTGSAHHKYAKLKLEVSDAQVAKEMRLKLDCLIRHSNAIAMAQYLTYKETRAQRRRTIHL